MTSFTSVERAGMTGKADNDPASHSLLHIVEIRLTLSVFDFLGTRNLSFSYQIYLHPQRCSKPSREDVTDLITSSWAEF